MSRKRCNNQTQQESISHPHGPFVVKLSSGDFVDLQFVIGLEVKDGWVRLHWPDRKSDRFTGGDAEELIAAWNLNTGSLPSDNLIIEDEENDDE